MNKRKIIVLLGLMVLGFSLALFACEEPSKPSPAPTAPVAGIPPSPREISPVPVPATLPEQKSEVTKTAPIGMKLGERFHEVHTTKLNLKCETCHVKQAETYYDPMSQVSNPVDNRACLSCHAESSVQPFYGANWGKASVKK